MTSGPDLALLQRGHPISLSRQLAARLEAAIRDGHIGSGARLPSTRDLARRLGIHRSTVGAAYARLRRRGWIEGSQGRRPSVPVRWRPPAPAATAGAGRLTSPDDAARRIVENALRVAYRDGVPCGATAAAMRSVADGLGEPASPPRVWLFEPGPGLRTALVAELRSRLGVPVESLSRPRGVGAPALVRREVLGRLEARPYGPKASRDRRASWIPLSLAGGTRERGLVRRAVRTGLVVLFSPSRAVRRHAAELAVREFARGVSFLAINPYETHRAVRAAAAARLVLCDAASVDRIPLTRARIESVELLPEREIEALRRYFELPAPGSNVRRRLRTARPAETWCGT